MTKKQALTDTLPRFIQLLPEEAVELLDFFSIHYIDGKLRLMFTRNEKNWVTVELGETQLRVVNRVGDNVSYICDSADLAGFHTLVVYDELIKALKAL